jgi:MSHA pilin protein MshA
MKSSQSGFTLIELVMVIVIIGVLAAIAVPKFIDLSGDANQAATDGVAGALSSAAATNYAARKANVSNGAAVANCQDVSALLQSGALPNSSYSIGTATIAPGITNTTCTLTGPGAKTAKFTATGIL